jgi:hypothetical protein
MSLRSNTFLMGEAVLKTDERAFTLIPHSSAIGYNMLHRTAVHGVYFGYRR